MSGELLDAAGGHESGTNLSLTPSASSASGVLAELNVIVRVWRPVSGTDSGGGG